MTAACRRCLSQAHLKHNGREHRKGADWENNQEAEFGGAGNCHAAGGCSGLPSACQAELPDTHPHGVVLRGLGNCTGRRSIRPAAQGLGQSNLSDIRMELLAPYGEIRPEREPLRVSPFRTSVSRTKQQRWHTNEEHTSIRPVSCRLMKQIQQAQMS